MDEATNVIDRRSASHTGELDAAVLDRGERGWQLSYNPALDGIRGISVAVVLLFHAGYPWARGGYLGVSTFFTLSGFLITSLLLGERRAAGHISLSRFWARRMRRLLPAATLTLVGVAIASRVVADLRTPGLSGDIVASSLQVANWRFLFDDQAYADLFTSPSPVLHFWSLAIEEQFYWAFPLLTVIVFALAKGSVRWYAAALGALLAVSAVATLRLGVDEATTVYYATYTRMGEILVGCLLAVAVSFGPTRLRGLGTLAAVGGVLALAAMVWCWVELEQDAPAVSRGGLLVYAVLSGTLVCAACVPGPLRRLLAFEPLRLLGLVSYGVYLVHWPIFLVLDGERTGLDRTPLFVLRVAVTLAVAIASFVLLERPIRRGWSLPRVPMPAVAGITVVAVTLVGVVVPASPGGAPDRSAEELWDDPTFQDPSRIPTDALIGVSMGDSTMLQTGRGLVAWGNETGDLVLPFVSLTDGLGCPVSRGGVIRFRNAEGAPREGCETWADRISPEVRRVRERYGRLDVALIQTGPWEVTDRLLPGDDEWRAPGDPVYDEFLYREFAEATDRFLAEGVVVVWILAPAIDIGRNEEPPPPAPYPESDPERMARLNEIIERVADERGGAVTVDLPGHLRGLPGGELDAGLRPDGVHFDLQSSYEVARDWLGQAVLDAADDAAAEPDAPARASVSPG